MTEDHSWEMLSCALRADNTTGEELPEDLCPGSKDVVDTLNGAQCPLQTPETGESDEVLIPIRQIL